MKARCLLLSLFLLSSSLGVASSRKESTTTLKKIVYSGDCKTCPQIVVDDFGDSIYWAVISIPEITFANMPSISVWYYSIAYSSDGASGWVPANQYYCRISEGQCQIQWKKNDQERKRFFKIVIVQNNI